MATDLPQWASAGWEWLSLVESGAVEIDQARMKRASQFAVRTPLASGDVYLALWALEEPLDGYSFDDPMGCLNSAVIWSARHGANTVWAPKSLWVGSILERPLYGINAVYVGKDDPRLLAAVVGV